MNTIAERIAEVVSDHLNRLSMYISAGIAVTPEDVEVVYDPAMRAWTARESGITIVAWQGYCRVQVSNGYARGWASADGASLEAIRRAVEEARQSADGIGRSASPLTWVR